MEEEKLTYSDCTHQSKWTNVERHEEEDVEGKKGRRIKRSRRK